MSGVEAQAEMLFNRLRKRFSHLRKWAARTGAGAYRLYDRDIPEIPLVLDFYSNDEVKAVSGALYKRPYEKDEGEEESWLSAMTAAAAEALNVNTQNIFLKVRRRQRHRLPGNENKFDTQYQKEDGAAFEMVIKENGLSFIVNLSGYIDTGIFPDLRLLRKMVMAEASGKTVLNLFCYTGSFSVYAAAGGARRVDSVDMSSTYLKWALRNCALNNVRTSPARADVFRFLDEAAASGRRWDMIVADPPVFSNSKKMKGGPLGGVFDIKHDYQYLLSKCLALLNGGGRLFFCARQRVLHPLRGSVAQASLRQHPLRVNTLKFRAREFGFQAGDLRDTFEGVGAEKNISVRDITERVRDEDFRGKRMPVCYLITK
ncbi:MAG: class I SAM-dependent methyltransferase [Spirochaetaceae bacterium]|nr:class I SAM-dependent methyltransferase [Spirochaetaceae bacterium]